MAKKKVTTIKKANEKLAKKAKYEVKKGMRGKAYITLDIVNKGGLDNKAIAKSISVSGDSQEVSIWLPDGCEFDGSKVTNVICNIA